MLYIIKKQRKASELGLWKVSRSFWGRKTQRAPICLWTIQKSFWRREKEKVSIWSWIKNLSEDEKQRLTEKRKFFSKL